MLALTWLVAGLLTAAPASAALAADVAPVPIAADTRMADALAVRASAFGSQFSGQVVDVGSGTVVWGRGAGRPLNPASAAKLVTASNALAVFGAGHRITTSVRRGTSWRDVVLVGAGDPSLSGADLVVLARTTAAALRVHRASGVTVWFDDSLFAAPTPAPGWKADYVPGSVRAVRALVVDEHHAADTSLDATRVFAAKLRAAGVGVAAVRRGRAPTGAATVARVRGDRLDAIVAEMLMTSDNDHAEALHRLVALGAGQRATWAGSAAAGRSVLSAQGVLVGSARLDDGSGLSLRDRLSAGQLVALVTHTLDPLSATAPVATSLPVAGVSGTLRASLGRFSTAPSRCAAGLVHAKTGTLDQAVALAGWATGADGRVKAFAFVVNGAGDSLSLKRRIDTLAATVTGCY